MWLGVAPYLTEEAVYGTLSQLSRFAGGAEVVFDYAYPAHAIEDANAREYHSALADHVASSGEPFLCYLETPELHARAGTLGYVVIEDLDRVALVARYLPHIQTTLRPGPGGHIVRMASG